MCMYLDCECVYVCMYMCTCLCMNGGWRDGRGREKGLERNRGEDGNGIVNGVGLELGLWGMVRVLE